MCMHMLYTPVPTWYRSFMCRSTYSITAASHHVCSASRMPSLLMPSVREERQVGCAVRNQKPGVVAAAGPWQLLGALIVHAVWGRPSVEEQAGGWCSAG